MARYSFPQFKVEIVDPTIKVVSVNDNLESMTCSVNIVLTTLNGDSFGVTIDGFNYSSMGTWEDSDVYDFIVNSLTENQVEEAVSNRMMMNNESEQKVEIKNTTLLPKNKLSLWKRFVLWLKRIFKRK
jgi:hypothetical protein